METYEEVERKKITIQFTPDIQFDIAQSLIGKVFYCYRFEFEVRILFADKTNKTDGLNSFFICGLPYDIIDDIVKTIESN